MVILSSYELEKSVHVNFNVVLVEILKLCTCESRHNPFMLFIKIDLFYFFLVMIIRKVSLSSSLFARGDPCWGLFFFVV